MIYCWHRFNEQLTPNPAQASSLNYIDLPYGSFKALTYDPQALELMSTAHGFSLPLDIESRAWFVDSGASHHLTSRVSYLYSKKSYLGTCRVRVANG